MPRPDQVLIVCTANQCRSPLAEFLLRDLVAEHRMNWTVGSAGTHAIPGRPMDPKAQRLLERRGLDVADWRSRQVDTDLVGDAEVILTADREHRSLLVRSRPDLVRRTFPVLRFARLAARVRDSGQWCPSRDPMSVLVDAVRRVELPGSADEDLADPVGRSFRHFKRCADQLDDAFRLLLG